MAYRDNGKNKEKKTWLRKKFVCSTGQFSSGLEKRNSTLNTDYFKVFQNRKFYHPEKTEKHTRPVRIIFTTNKLIFFRTFVRYGVHSISHLLHGYGLMTSEGKDQIGECCLEVVILGEHGKSPQKANLSDAGYDLFASQACEIAAWSHELVKTDIAITVPLGTYGRIAPRSGLSLKNGIHVGAGVVDRGYTGPVGIVIFNLSDKSFQVNIGDRIAQLILEKIAIDVPIRLNKQLPSSIRGSGGFGSSGVQTIVATSSPAITNAVETVEQSMSTTAGENKIVTKRKKMDESSEGKGKNGVGRLVMLVGPMFASKTTSLRAFAQRYALAKKNCLVVKFSKDTRYSSSVEQELITHDKLKVPASCIVEKLSEIPSWPYNQADVILIDEAQFYSGLSDFCEKATNEGKVVIAAGLVSTWDQKPFCEMCNLLALADEVIMLKAVCTNCGEDAIFTKRIVPYTQLQLIGGSDLYTARCRACHPL